jgi:hypothetical protein
VLLLSRLHILSSMNKEMAAWFFVLAWLGMFRIGSHESICILSLLAGLQPEGVMEFAKGMPLHCTAVLT